MKLRVGIGLVFLLVAACGAQIDPRLRIDFGTIGTYYPGSEVSCAEVEHCDDVLAEVAGFLNHHDTSRGPASRVTLHAPASADGRNVHIHRSGGATWIAIVTFGDGARTAVIVGCGVGTAQERCFSQDSLGRQHDSDGPPR